MFETLSFFMQESTLYGAAENDSLSSATIKLGRIGQGNHSSRDFWRFAKLPVVSWIDLRQSVPRMDSEFLEEQDKFLKHLQVVKHHAHVNHFFIYL